MNAKQARFVSDLDRAGITADVKVLDQGIRTAAAAANHLGCEVAGIAKSLAFDCDGEPLLIMPGGAGRASGPRPSARRSRFRCANAIRCGWPRVPPIPWWR